MAVHCFDMIEMPEQRHLLAYWQKPANRKKRTIVVDEIEPRDEDEADSCEDEGGDVQFVSELRRSPSAVSQTSEATQSSTQTRVDAPVARRDMTTPFIRQSSVRTVGVQLAKRPKRDWRDIERGIETAPGPCQEPYRSCGFA